MIQIIEHRKNSIESLAFVNPQNGVEVDFRSNIKVSGEIVLTHDSYSDGPNLKNWFSEFKKMNISGPIIVNTKEDQLEETIINFFNENHFSNYLFLDTAIPTLVKFYNKGLGQHFFLRLSKYENLDFCLHFKDQVKWLWVDCFDGKILEEEVLIKAKKYFKLCFVSPELHGYDIDNEDVKIKIQKSIRHFDMVCCKKIEKFQNFDK